MTVSALSGRWACHVSGRVVQRDVLRSGQQLQVLRVDARPVAASVVDVVPVGDVLPVVGGPGETVGERPVQHDVAVRSRGTGQRAAVRRGGHAATGAGAGCARNDTWAVRKLFVELFDVTFNNTVTTRPVSATVGVYVNVVSTRVANTNVR